MLSADVKTRLWQTSRDEQAQALCVNFVLQATKAQSLGTRLGGGWVQARVGKHILLILESPKWALDGLILPCFVQRESPLLTL